jgi:hypothetical protein
MTLELFISIDMSWFLAADFDKANWEDECIIERLGAGRGGHWKILTK